MKNAELEGLIHGYLDDRLSGEEVAQLNDSLRHSTLAREQFWQVAELEGYLADLADWRRGQEQATDLAMPEALQVFLEMEQEARTTLRAIQPPPEPIKLRGPNLLERAASRGQRLVPYARPLGGALAAAAAVGLVLLLAIDWFGADKPASTGEASNVTQSAPDVEDDPTLALPVLTATVTNVYGPAAADNTTGPRIGESLRQGDADH
jgi:hypothetical protein